MNTEEFVYWLQGALEMNPEMLKNGMRPEQVQTIQDHLDLLFDKVTPDRFNKDVEINAPTLNDFRIANSGPSTGLSGSQLFCSQLKNEAIVLPSSSVSKKPGRKPRRKPRRTGPGYKC